MANEEYVKHHQLHNRRFTSKGEVEVRNYFINNFPTDEWTFGGPLKYKDNILTRDLYSNKLKICIEYDGIWHFKDINNQLVKKQLKDKLLEEWCILNGFRLIRIRDEIYNSNKEKYIDILKNEIYNGNNKIIKFY